MSVGALAKEGGRRRHEPTLPSGTRGKYLDSAVHRDQISSRRRRGNSERAVQTKVAHLITAPRQIAQPGCSMLVATEGLNAVSDALRRSEALGFEGCRVFVCEIFEL